jgi:hypothetical protein
MATSVGFYSDFTMKFSLDAPLCSWDVHEYFCKKCEKRWVGGTTCFECQPKMLSFLAPRKEYLEENKFTGDIPESLKLHWEKHEPRKYNLPTNFNVSNLISRMRVQNERRKKAVLMNDMDMLVRRTNAIKI